jgi:hypothetical protein
MTEEMPGLLCETCDGVAGVEPAARSIHSCSGRCIATTFCGGRVSGISKRTTKVASGSNKHITNLRSVNLAAVDQRLEARAESRPLSPQQRRERGHSGTSNLWYSRHSRSRGELLRRRYRVRTVKDALDLPAWLTAVCASRSRAGQ